MNRFLRLSVGGALLLLLGLTPLFAQEVTFSAGPPTVPFYNIQGLGCIWGDLNNDGYPDLFVEPINVFLYNPATNTFTPVNPNGVTLNAGTVSELIADFDGDGINDLLIQPGGGTPILEKGAGNGTFTDISASVGLTNFAGGTTQPTFGFCAGDVNRDNYLDIAWSGGTGDAEPMQILLGGAAGFTAGGRTSLSPIIDTTKKFEAWEPHFVDVNNDRWPDFFVPSIRNGLAGADTGTTGARKGSVLFLNDGTGNLYVPNSTTLGRTIYSIGVGGAVSTTRDTGLIVDDTVRHFSAIASAWGDFDNDGNMDVLLIPLNGDPGAALHLLKGKGDGTFHDVTAGSGLVWNTNARGVAWGDYNNDGWLDILEDRGFAGQVGLWRNNGNGTFTDVGAADGVPQVNSRSGQFVDFNRDGFLDIYTQPGGSADTISVNGKNLNNWIAFNPVGTGHNKSAIGARFYIWRNGNLQMQDIDAGGGGSGNTSGNGQSANFGIGTSTSIDSVSIYWPDGTHQSFPNLAVNQYWKIVEGSAIPGGTSLIAPANASTGVAVSGFLSWAKATNAATYQVQVSMDPTFTNKAMMPINATVTDTALAFKLGPATKYYWRVSVMNGGFTSGYTTTNNFTTSGSAAVAVPVLVALHGATNQPAAMTLAVHPTVDASRYQWEVSSLPSFSGFTVNDSTSDTTKAVVLTGGRTYYWRVRGMNDLGASAFSAPDTFTVMTPPGAPGLVFPANNAVNVISDSVSFTWRKLATAASYTLKVSTINSTAYYTATDSTLKVFSLAKLTNYTWTVQAVNAGGTGPYAGNFAFTTVPAAPAAPAQISPASAATNVDRLTHFVWGSVVNATKYRLQVATDNAFTAIVTDTTIIDTTLKLATALAASGDFYWRVNAQNIGGASPYAGPRLMSTGTVLSVEEATPGAPKVFALMQNYPNPFNPTTTINYDLPKSSYVKIVIYDVLGRVVATLVDGVQPANRYTLNWNASNVASGVYFYRMNARSADNTGDFNAVRKLLLLK
ncbi:MAG TPA: FG-GAP-like repeat-containing protein [Bacteroidota bacterium]|nr:FG-GAP-like repeat-containing protein [Bacteroidota bacterium]